MGRVRKLALLFVLLTLVGTAGVFISFLVLGVPLPEERPVNLALWAALVLLIVLVVPWFTSRGHGAFGNRDRR